MLGIMLFVRSIRGHDGLKTVCNKIHKCKLHDFLSRTLKHIKAIMTSKVTDNHHSAHMDLCLGSVIVKASLLIIDCNNHCNGVYSYRKYRGVSIKCKWCVLMSGGPPRPAPARDSPLLPEERTPRSDLSDCLGCALCRHRFDPHAKPSKLRIT